MFYREFLKITNLFDEHFVDTFDFLAYHSSG